MNIGYWLKARYLRCKRQTWDFCSEFTAWQFATTCAAVKSIKPWMSSHFSTERDISYVVSPSTQNIPHKAGEASPVGYPNRKAARGWPRTRWCDCTSDLGPFHFSVEPAELSENWGISSPSWKNCEVFRVLLGLLPQRASPKENGYENECMNEEDTCFWSFLLNLFPITFCFVCFMLLCKSSEFINLNVVYSCDICAGAAKEFKCVTCSSLSFEDSDEQATHMNSFAERKTQHK